MVRFVCFEVVASSLSPPFWHSLKIENQMVFARLFFKIWFGFFVHSTPIVAIGGHGQVE